MTWHSTGVGYPGVFFSGKLFYLPRWIEGCTLGVGDALYFCFSACDRESPPI